MEPQDKELWRIAKRRADFKKSLTAYFIVNSFLCAVWFVTSRGYNNYFWPVWPILGWGLGLAFQYAAAYSNTGMFSVEEEYKKLKNNQDSSYK